MAETCIFCAITAGSIPAYVVAKNTGAIAFLDVAPIAPAHCVVVPTSHRQFVDDLSQEEVCDVFMLVQRVARAAKRAVDADAATIAINDGVAAGQAIPHVHVHIIPRFTGDGGTSVHSIVKNPPDRPLGEFVEEIKKYLDSFI